MVLKSPRKEGKASYPARADIDSTGFLTPAHGFDDHSEARPLAEANTGYNSVSKYPVHHPAPAPGPAAGALAKPSEALENRAGSPIGVGRTRSRKGILEIRTPEEEQRISG